MSMERFEAAPGSPGQPTFAAHGPADPGPVFHALEATEGHAKTEAIADGEGYGGLDLDAAGGNIDAIAEELHTVEAEEAECDGSWVLTRRLRRRSSTLGSAIPSMSRPPWGQLPYRHYYR